MNRARILFLRLKGIEISSEDDPRIAQVRDEDFVFGDEKILELDEECLRSLEEERAKRASFAGTSQTMTCGLVPRMNDMRELRRQTDARARDERCQPLEMKSRRQQDAHIGSSKATKQVNSLFGLIGYPVFADLFILTGTR